MAIALEKRAEEVKKIILEKKIDPIKVNMKLLVDKSGSMADLFRNGFVQDLCERVLAVGMNLDVNKSIEVFSFNNYGEEVGVANENNYKGFMKKVHAGGGTNYAPVMEMVWKGYQTTRQMEVETKQGIFAKMFGKKSTSTVTTQVSVSSSINENIPTYVVMVTDGDNFDPLAAERIVRETSGLPVFWQFVGLKTDPSTKFEFLKKLDTMEGRVIDNANFFEVTDVLGLTDDKLYRNLLNEFPDWVKLAKNAGILK